MIEDAKELDKFLKICRKHGVTEITFNEVSVKFGELPTKQAEADVEEVPTDELTPEQLMFYAVRDAGNA